MTRSAFSDCPSRADAGTRFWIWIDGVGGYLVCEAEQVLIGQPVGDGSVDIPILGDISRHHARLVREGENYFVEALRPICVDGRRVKTSCNLVPAMLVEMGHGVCWRLAKPHPLSASRRLDFASHHRTQPTSDGVILLAESCLLGPAAHCHVPCPDWGREVMLYRQGGRLHCRASGEFEIDGRSYQDRGPLKRSSHVVGPDFCFSLEEFRAPNG